MTAPDRAPLTAERRAVFEHRIRWMKENAATTFGECIIIMDELLAEIDRLNTEVERARRWSWDHRGRLIKDGHRVEFADLPSGTRNALIGNGFYTRSQVMRATDDELLAGINFGKRSLAKVREVMPYMPDRAAVGELPEEE